MDLSSQRPAVWSAHKPHTLTRSARDVLLTLATFRRREGRIHPSHATLAARVGCCVNTVKAALAAGRQAGLVSWASGRWRRTSNRYVLELPRDAPVARQPQRVERALVARWRLREENQPKKGVTGGRTLAPHPPVRTVAEQIAALMRPTSEAEKREVQESLAIIAAHRAAEREVAWRTARTAQKAWNGREGGMAKERS